MSTKKAAKKKPAKKAAAKVMTMIKTATGRLSGRRLTPPAAPAPLGLGGFPGAPAAPAAPGPAAGGGIASAQRVFELVQAAFAGKLVDGNIQRYGDSNFYLPTQAEVMNILTASQTDRRTWTAERFDCDDFSYVLKGEFSVHAYDAGALSYGFALGIIWGNFSWVNGFHAVNFAVLNTGAVMLIEPQDDRVFAASQCVSGVNLIVV